MAEHLKLKDNHMVFPYGFYVNLGDGFPTSSYSFSRTEFGNAKVVTQEGGPKLVLSLEIVFENALTCLKSKGVTEEEQNAYQRLNKFLESDVGNCPWATATTEKEFNAIFANNVIIPLTSSTCIIKWKPKNMKHHKNLKLPEEYGVQGLVIGSPKSYHGELDMVVVPPGSKDVIKESKTVPVSYPTSEEDMLDEPPEGEEPDDRNETNENKSSPGKLKTFEERSLSHFYQSIATLLMFSKIQRSRHPDVSHAFPMLIVCPTEVVILIYQSETDTLLFTQVMEWGETAFFFVWAVLHHSIFPIKLPQQHECGFKEATKNFSFDDCWYLDNQKVFQTDLPFKVPLYDFACYE